METADIASYDGWYAWRRETTSGPTLHDLRVQLVTESQEGSVAQVGNAHGTSEVASSSTPEL
jgi:hypothetical protein